MNAKSLLSAKLTSNLKVSDKKAFNNYLRDLWPDLLNRRIKNENDKVINRKQQDSVGITKLIFSNYYYLPGIIGERLFHVFDSKKKDLLEFNVFKTGMNTLFCDNYYYILRFIFDFYDFDDDGRISKEDIRVILSYVESSNNKKIIQNDKTSEKIIINTQELYETSVKNQNQLIEILEKCFENMGDLIDFKKFIYIVENINSSIFFKIYIFLLQKRPFSKKALELYNKINNEAYSYSTISEINTDISKINYNVNIPMASSLVNQKITPSINKFMNSTMKNSKSVFNEIVNFSMKDYENFKRKQNSNRLSKSIGYNITKNNKSKIFNQVRDIGKTFYEIKLGNDILEEMNKIKGYIEEEDDNEEEYEIESEKNIYEGYIYKFNKGKMKKMWFKLFFKDLYFYNKKNDLNHIGMHNISGLFFKEEKQQVLDNKIYYSFSIIFPSKKHYYFCDNEQEFQNWTKHFKIATKYSNILDIYEIKDNLGSGSFSLVKLAINKYTKEKVAVKIMDKKKMNTARLESARTEIEIMKICQHPNIIHFIDSYENANFIYIFMEYCDGGTLFNFLKKRNFILKEELAMNLVYKISKAIYYFHSFGITHRDLKPENILMTSNSEDANIKILDFGLGKIIGPNEKCSEPYGTIIYCAPEIISDCPYTKNVDSWSLGIITYIMLYGKLPFWDKDRAKLSGKIVNENPLYKGNKNYISDEAKNFIQNLLVKNQYKRMNIKQALEHKWFQKFNKNYVVKNKDRKNDFQFYTSVNMNTTDNSSP